MNAAHTTLCLCIRDNSELLLAVKKVGFGAGKLNGAGGKIQSGESTRTAATRELSEEFGLTADPSDLDEVALLHFYFGGELRVICTVFALRRWQGEPTETEEMGSFTWNEFSNLPFDQMWVGDPYWMPPVLNGEQIEASVYFNEEGSVLEEFVMTPLEPK
ncbi:MAG: NUDIX hydrolase [Parcubacteria group bacterium GW2011_GWF2_44_8]|nr:MAG: NUDIX hydrolase [Parcubacteria group bacterium GW2011_GWF2_44_8]